MAIIGIRRLTWLVEDMAQCTEFFTDFGLSLVSEGQSAGKGEALFELPDGSQTLLLERGHPRLPTGSAQTGKGVFECVWAVDSEEGLARIKARLEPDSALVTDDEGVVHFVTPFGDRKSVV